ncbi:MAG: T9SS type A sorting domain-containing protein [Bacteroidales bacterium]|nr:T9SS type A sorting domain-containing protein [Bacteroidales bacterium]
MFVTVNPAAQVNDPADFATCHNTGTSVTFSTVNSGGTTTYDWTNSNTSIGLVASGTGNISSFTATNPGTVPITATITVTPSFDGCPGTPQTFIITVNPLPTLSSVSQVSQICSGAKATINLTGLIGISSAVTYQIGTNTPVTKTGITVTGGNATFQTDNLDAVNNGKTFTVESITNENTGCSATFSQSTLLIVNTATIPTLSGDLTPCINSTEVYTTQSGMNTNSYVWTFSGGETPSGGGINDNTITVTWTSISTKTISVNFTNSSGCTAASATTISPVVSALPTPAISGPASVCINSTGNVYSTLAGMSGYDWEITGGTITSGGDNSSVAVVTWTADPGSITVNYTNSSGCAATSPTVYNVTVHPLPVVTTANTASTCSGTSPNIALTASVASSFTWTVGTISGSISGATSGSGSTINQVLGNASNSAAGTVEYLVTPTSTTGSCAGSPYSIVVTVYPSPVVTNSAAVTICSGTGPNISLTSSVPGSFTWTVGANSGGITGASAGFGNTINQVLTNPGNSTAGTLQYLIVPTSTTGTCLGNTYSIVVTVNPTPVVTTAATKSICSGTAPNILLTASTQSTFSWTVGSVTGSISGSSAGSGSTISQVLTNPSNTVAGTVEYLVTPVSITGSCTGAPYSIIVTVNPLPLPGLAGPLTARVTSTGNLYSTEAGMNTYIWSVSSGGSVTAGGTSGSNTVTVSWNTTGTQNVSVKYTNTNNCTALVPTPASVTVNPLPSVSSVTISGTPAIGNTLTGGYSYSDGGGGGSSISTFKWFRDGTEISGEVLNTYLLTGADQNKSITFEVTPKTSAGFPNTGTPVVSSPTIPVENLSEIPVADQVCIEGVRTAGNILKGKYRYTHSKPEGTSTYKWYKDGVVIPSATGTQYTLLASDIDNDEDITFEVTPVSSNVVPVTGTPASSNPMAKMPLVPTDYSVAVSAVPLTASPTGGIFSGPGVTNGIFSPSTVGIGGSPYSIQYLLNIVNSSTSCSQSVWKAVNVVTNTTEFSSFKDVYCQTDDPDEIVITGLLTGLTSLGFTHTDADAIVGSTAWTVTVDPRKMRPGNNKDYLNFRYKDSRGIVYQISKSFVVDSVGTGLQIINLGNEYCAETPKVNISVTGTYPSGGTGAWTSSLLSDLAATSASVNVALVPAGPTYPLSYQYTSPLGCKSIVINKSVTVNPLPNPSFTIAPFYNIDGGAATLVPVQSPGTFSGNGVSGDKLYPDIAGLGEHTINYRITDTKGCVDDLNIKTTVKTAQGTFTDIPAIICYRDTTFNVKVTGLPAGMTVNSFVNTRNSIDHIVGATDANYSVKAAGHGLDTLTFSYKLDNVDYWISKVVNIDSLGVVQIQNLFAGDKVCDNRAPFELFTSMPGGVFTGPVAGNYLDPTKATGATSVLYKYTNSRTGCSTSTAVPFSIIPAPQVAFVPKDVCIESNRDSTYFLNTTVSSDPVFEWTWTFAEVGAAPSNRKEPAFLYKTGGIHAVSLNVRTVSGCNVTKTSNVDLGIRPIADFTWKNDCFAADAKLSLTDATFTNFPVISRTWNFNNGSLISSDLNPEYTMQDTGYVHVKYIVRTSYANCADTVSRKIYLRPTITIPKDGFYYQNFEAGKAGWGKDDSDPNLIWSFGTPDRTRINKAKSGSTAWYTRYESDKQGKIDTTSVISPCFDFTNIQRPMITLQAFKIFEKNRNGAALQYKTEGSDWKYVGTLEDGINWYNSTLINGKPGGDKIGWTTLSEEAADVDYVPSSHALDELKGKKNVKFRLAYGSDGNSLDKEGIAFDDIWIGERTRKVLLEHFTNTFSKKGSEATAFVNKIIKVRDKDVINIQYHTNFPDDDPFYLVNPGDASARIFSYGLSKVPYSLIDGGYSNDLYASLSDYKAEPLDSNDLSRRSLLDSKFSLTITPKITGGVLTVNSTVTALNAFTSDNLILYLAVTEKEAISDKPAALGEVNFKNVFRKFIPDAGGIDLKKTWTKGESFAIPEKTWVIENIKNNSDIEVIAFVQNSQTKEVYQVASGLLKTGKSVFDNLKLDENAIGTESSLLPEIITFGLYPNPASDKLRIEFSDKLAAETDIKIFDFQGAVKKTYKVASGESELFIEDIGLKAGIYLVRISSGGVDLGFRKLIITGN